MNGQDAEELIPPYPDETLSKGWRFELHMEKVKKSDTWLRARSGFVRAHLLLLWSESWEQTPCGTLPNDDELIALLLDMDDATYAKHKTVLMRGWRLATNGRLYHETITDRVLAMLEKRMKDAQRTANSRARRSESRNSNQGQASESRVTDGWLTGEFDTKHQAPEPVTSSSDVLVNTHTGENAKNPSDPEKKPRKRGAAKSRLVSVERLVADGVQEKHAADWLAIREKKGLPLTGTAWDEVKRQAALSVMSPAQAVELAVNQGWAGLRHSWVEKALASDLPASHLPTGASRTTTNRQEALEASNNEVASRWAAQGATHEEL